MNRFSLIILYSGVVMGCTSENAGEIISQYERAHNTHNVEYSMALYDNDIEFELEGVWIKSGKEEIRELEEWDAALNSHLRFESILIKEDTVFCKVIENNDWFRALNINDLVHEPTVFILRNNKIKKIIASPSEKTSKEIQAAIASIYQWSEAANDSTIDELIQEAEFIYSRETARKWLDLFKRRSSSEYGNSHQD